MERAIGRAGAPEASRNEINQAANMAKSRLGSLRRYILEQYRKLKIVSPYEDHGLNEKDQALLQYAKENRIFINEVIVPRIEDFFAMLPPDKKLDFRLPFLVRVRRMYRNGLDKPIFLTYSGEGEERKLQVSTRAFASDRPMPLKEGQMDRMWRDNTQRTPIAALGRYSTMELIGLTEKFVKDNIR